MSKPPLPRIEDFAEAEHFVLEDVEAEQRKLTNFLGKESAGERELREEIVIDDRLRGRRTAVRLYAEGWADIESKRRGRLVSVHSIDLRYLDPVPTTSRTVPHRLLKAAGIAASATGILALPAWFGLLATYTVPAALTALTVTLGLLFTACYLTNETIVFKTLHGRAEAIRLNAGLGKIRRFRKLIPKIVDSIAGAAESVYDETVVYLRAEMREHYRLRNDGVLSVEECAASTGRILSQFDGPS